MHWSFLVYLVACWQTTIFGGDNAVSAQQCAPEERQQTMLLGIKAPAKYLGHQFPVQTPQECYDACCSWDHGPADRCNAAVYLAVDSDCIVLQCEPFENCAWGSAALAGANGATVARVWRRVAHFWSSPGDETQQLSNVLAPPEQLSTLAADGSSQNPVSAVPYPAENPEDQMENVLLNPPMERTPAFDGQTPDGDPNGNVNDGNGNDGTTSVEEPAAGVLEKPTLPAAEDENEQFGEGGVIWNEGGKDDGWKLFGNIADFEAAEKENLDNDDLEKDEVVVDGEANGLHESFGKAVPWNDIVEGQQVDADASPTELPVAFGKIESNDEVVHPETDGWNEGNETPPKNDEDAWNIVPHAADVTEFPVAEQIGLEIDAAENQDVAVEDNYDEWNDGGEKALLVVEDENWGPSTVNNPNTVQENSDGQQNLENPTQWMDNVVWSPIAPLPSEGTIDEKWNENQNGNGVPENPTDGQNNDGWSPVTALPPSVVMANDYENPNNINSAEAFILNIPGLNSVPINEYDPRMSEVEMRLSSPSEAYGMESENISGVELNSSMILLILLSVLSVGTIFVLFIYRQYFVGRSLGPRYTPLRETKVEPPSSSSYLVSSPRYLD